MTQVVFDPVGFKARYPEFSAINAGTLTTYFNEAGMYLSNADDSPIQSIPRRTILLNMLTAHIGALAGALDDGSPIPLGRTSSAHEGAVSVTFDYVDNGTPAWFKQTQYGTAFWQATTAVRGFTYRPNPTVY